MASYYEIVITIMWVLGEYLTHNAQVNGRGSRGCPRNTSHDRVNQTIEFGYVSCQAKCCTTEKCVWKTHSLTDRMYIIWSVQQNWGILTYYLLTSVVYTSTGNVLNPTDYNSGGDTVLLICHKVMLVSFWVGYKLYYCFIFYLSV